LVPASRLGYRITEIFSYKYLGKIFDEPQTVFTEGMLRPETQDIDAFADGVLNIANGHKKAALAYFEDGGAEEAIPPLKALLSIMAYGEYEGNDISSSEVRDLFKKENVINSKWYQKRLQNKQQIEINLIEQKIANLTEFISAPVNQSIIGEFKYEDRLENAKEELEYFKSEAYLKSLVGTLGAEDISLR